ncbi:hypothetical protein AVEN_23024-1 [Araneus ventricosus]|uniref:Uncharacterized protein n=1 Tax=Araneus ventricosus TaxID=182803 RepID=A0A4Y2LKB3_ARAVE|nr:hypothetical protein AVEN_23024-1 [Araneus ventricosus]
MYGLVNSVQTLWAELRANGETEYEKSENVEHFWVKWIREGTHVTWTEAALSYRGKDRSRRINLYLHNDHFDVITSLQGFYAADHYSESCDKPYGRVEDRRCPNACHVCFRTDCLPGQTKRCNDCDRLCQSEECFQTHKETPGRQKFSLCDKGCFFHGCPDCFDGDALNPLLGLTMNALFEKTKATSAKLQKAGCILVEKWEHEFRREIELDADLQKFVQSHDLKERLNPRDVFYGGRTNAVKLYFEGTAKNQIFFYPYDMAYGSGPTAPRTTEPNKGRHPPALGIPSLGAYLGASRNLYAQGHPRGQ